MKSKAVRYGSILVLQLQTALFSQFTLIDDHSDGTDQNELFYSWYYYDDETGLKSESRDKVDSNSTPSVINVPVFTPEHPIINPAVKKHYQFTLDEENGNRFATMPFTFGDSWQTSFGTAEPYVGIVTMLAPLNGSIDCSGMSEVRFRIKSRKNPLVVTFKVQTLDIEQDSTEGYYEDTITVGTEWVEQTVRIEDLKQPQWARSQCPFEFDITKCTKLVWEVAKIHNENVSSDTLDIDDIYLANPLNLCWGVWPFYSSTLALPESGQFASFEGAAPEITPIDTRWYAFDDSNIGGTSRIISGAVRNQSTRLSDLLFENEAGSENSIGAFINYEIGPSIKQNEYSVPGYVGIGCNLYDSADVVYFNASANNVSSIYFQYRADGNAGGCITLEVLDRNDVADRLNPDRTVSSRGAVWTRNLPNTNGTWRAVEVPFDSLLLAGGEGLDLIPLDRENLAKIQFRINGHEDDYGSFAVDNVYFPGMESTASLHNVKRSAKLPGIHISYHNGKLNIRCSGDTRFISGKISLIRPDGVIVKSRIFQKAGLTGFSTGKLASGVYVVHLKALDSKGKVTVLQSPFTVTR